jgi:redox-sensitive bicupin YhaK (pirin superfamily)
MGSLKARGSRLFGLQTWVALPVAREENEPSFTHYNEADLPILNAGGKRIRLMVGRAWGLTSPVRMFSDTIYADIMLDPGARLPVDTAYEERAVYVVAGTVDIAEDRSSAGQLVVLRPGNPVTLSNATDKAARIAVVGGETMDGPRHIWWNFVSSRRERIEQAKADWKVGGFPTVPGIRTNSFRCLRTPHRTSVIPGESVACELPDRVLKGALRTARSCPTPETPVVPQFEF